MEVQRASKTRAAVSPTSKDQASPSLCRQQSWQINAEFSSNRTSLELLSEAWLSQLVRSSIHPKDHSLQICARNHRTQTQSASLWIRPRQCFHRCWPTWVRISCLRRATLWATYHKLATSTLQEASGTRTFCPRRSNSRGMQLTSLVRIFHSIWEIRLSNLLLLNSKSKNHISTRLEPIRPEWTIKIISLCSR